MNLRTLLRHPATLLVAVIAAFAIGLAVGGGGDDATSGAEHDHTAADDAEPQLYTCSMHPSVRLEDPDARCPICFMDLIPVTGNGGPNAERRLTLDESTVAAARIQTTRVARFFPRPRCVSTERSPRTRPGWPV